MIKSYINFCSKYYTDKENVMKSTGLIVLLCLMIFIAHFTLNAADNVSYNNDIKQLISAKNCSNCHFFMGSYKDIIAQKINGIPLVNIAKPDSSVLIWRIEGKTPSGPLYRMPDGGPYYSEEEINLFKTWIAQGALEDIAVDVETTTRTWSEIKLKFK